MWTDLLAWWARRLRPALTPNRPPLAAEDTGVIRLPLEWGDSLPVRRPGATVTTERALRAQRLARGESLPTAQREGSMEAARLRAQQSPGLLRIPEDGRETWNRAVADEALRQARQERASAVRATLGTLRTPITAAIQEDLRAYFGECQRHDRRPLTWDSASIATDAAMRVLRDELT